MRNAPYLIALLLLLGCSARADSSSPTVPAIDGDFWRIGAAPDLGALNGEPFNKQHVVDHGFVQDENGRWHLWACIRGTKAGRLLYEWEGASLTDGALWEQKGIAARASAEWGEQAEEGREHIQAPFFMKIDDTYYCFYNSAGIRVMTSSNGADYERERIKNDSNVLYEKGGRDVMVMKEGDRYFAYSTVSTIAKDDWLRGFVIVRTSRNLTDWSDYTIVSEGGRAGNGAVSAESPFVQKYKGMYYLFRSSSSTGTTFVYRSANPYDFGVNTDEKFVAELPVWAPEILFHEGEWFISDIADFQGVKLARLKWVEE